jgi:integrase
LRKSFKNYDWIKEECVQRWLTGLAERTKKNYKEEFGLWLNFIDMTPTEQIKKRMQNLTSQNITERTFFENKFREFKEYLEQNTELSSASIRTKIKTVASFFSRNSLPLALKRGDWQSTKETEVIKRKFQPTNEDIKKMYAHASLRDRALLLVLYQSGFSEIDVSALKIEDLSGLWEMPQTEHYYIQKPREKTGVIQATCISYEALHDIRAMLQEREELGEGYLFVSQTKEKGSQIEVRRINEAMKTLAQKTFDKEKAKQFKTKSLRSAYNSALLRANIQPQELKDVMMGHKRLGARGHYAYDETTIKEAYSQAFEHLTINGIQAREDLAKLKEEFDRKTEEQNRELQVMRKILISVISRDKLEAIIQKNLVAKGETGKAQIDLKKLSDKQLLKLYQKTL